MIIVPSFLVIGAQRCGTTSLYNILDEHPQIYMAKPLNPEPKFFLPDKHLKKGKEFYIKRWFSDCGSAKIAGEKSTSYLEKPETAERISRIFPEMKIIVILRDPIDRAFSNYKFSVKHGLEHEDFKTAIYNEEERIKNLKFPGISVHPLAYLHRGRYINYIKGYLEIFPNEQLLILFFDDLKERKKVFCERLYRFLGADADYQPKSLTHITNASEDLKVTVERDLLEYMQKYFSECNKKLEDMTGRDLSCWQKAHTFE